MWKKMLHSFVALMVVFMMVVTGASAADSLPPGSIGVEKTLLQNGLKFNMILSQTTDPLELGSILFKVKTKVTNVSTKPITYIINGCDVGIHSDVILENGSTLPLHNPPGCTDIYAVEELAAGKSIEREEVYTTKLTSNTIVPDQYNLKSTFQRGDLYNQQYVELITPFAGGITLATKPLELKAKLTKNSSKYDLNVDGLVKDTTVQKVYLTVGKTKYPMKIHPQTKKLSLKKKIKINGEVPNTATMEIEYAGQIKHFVTIPIEISPEK
ncbi:hypothetical protein [Brevibacillus sp. SYSU BS000544]|uniref:hypothetical protein n=1 Tax=Brevibacillus sp. SYSU BS000544 TaxID=3416443 RepID=UPI003CE596F8